MKVNELREITKKYNETEKENTDITIERLEKEVKYFLECAYDDLYARPNKIYGNRIIKGTS